MTKNFSDFGLSINAIKAIEKKRFTQPTEVQEKIIPLILAGEKDLLVQSRTGTGKTAAFAIPLIEKLEEKKPNQLLIMAPTRELVIQLSSEIHSLCGRKHLKIALLYGGQSYASQEKRLRQNAEIVIGTPGRIQDHIERKNYSTDKIDYLILDEVDQMLRTGFAIAMEEILRKANRARRTYFFSATVPYQINNLAKVYTKKLEKVIIDKQKITDEFTEQLYIEMFSHDKFANLKNILAHEADFYGIIFCRTRLKAKHLGTRLAKLGFAAAGIHGDLAQDIREQVIGKFRHRKITILTATDVAARGLDVPELTHIINYSLPQTPDIFVHRVGRTARAGKTGIAITFVTPEDERKFAAMKKELKQNISRREISFYDTPAAPQPAAAAHSETEMVRLFIALGSKNDMDNLKLLGYLEKNCGVKSENIHNMLVSDTFSFISTQQADAELILAALGDKKNGKRKMVEIAKPDTKKTSKPRFPKKQTRQNKRPEQRKPFRKK
ncbi:MAG: DEAD/DEAH box helicase [Candidatus Cloacimonadales bacterium]